MSVKPFDDIFIYLLYERIGRAFFLFQHIIEIFYHAAELLMLFFMLGNSGIIDRFLELFLLAEVELCRSAPCADCRSSHFLLLSFHQILLSSVVSSLYLFVFKFLRF